LEHFSSAGTHIGGTSYLHLQGRTVTAEAAGSSETLFTNYQTT